MIGNWWSGIVAWVSGWFSDQNRAKVVDVLNHAQAFIAYALPIVESIDKTLKPVIKDAMAGNCDTPIACLISRFLEQYGMDSSAAEKAGLELQGMPIADLSLNVALFALKHVAPDVAASSILRLAIELAYNVYKGAKQ